jgi:polyphenol oxidase
MSRPESSIAQSRRSFLREMAIGTLLIPTVSNAVCEPPGTPGSAKPWRADCRPIRQRRPASTLSAADIQQLKNAYQAMRDLSVSDPGDPRGFTHQANIHCWYCSVSNTPVHGNWQFFAWHRAYLYFHERILGKLINDSEFRLPYWDWEVSTHRKIPDAYVSPNNATNSLWNSTRAMSPADELPDEDVNEDVMELVYGAANFAEFGGTAADSGIPEGSPHGSVHVDVGGFLGDMGAFDTAGRDPIFYAHHSNVDKLWSDWNRGASSHENPTDASFLNLNWSFHDENKVWRSIKASQLQNHETQLRYTYGLSRFREILPCIIDWIIVRPPWRFDRAVVIEPRLRDQLLAAIAARKPVRMHIDYPQLPLNMSAVYRVYADPKEAEEDKGPQSPAYLGVIPIVLNTREKHHPPKPPRVVFNVKRRLGAMLRSPDGIQLAYVERGAKRGATTGVQLLNARDVYFSYGEPMRE